MRGDTTLATGEPLRWNDYPVMVLGKSTILRFMNRLHWGDWWRYT